MEVGGLNAVSGAGRREELTRLAEKWVSQTFFGTLLKQMRNSPFRSELFDGGRGGQAFGALHDQQLADRMSRGAGQKLVRSIVRQLEAISGYEKAEAGRMKDEGGSWRA
jgi:Rod binding domain-containing protein